MNIVITGHLGLLGTEISKRLSDQHTVTGKDIDSIDITSKLSCQELIQKVQPDVLINCAAYTNVDRAESDQDNAFAVNADGPLNLAELSSDFGIRLIHFSTDYVFDGTKKGAYLENDNPCPLGIYGKSKLAGEMNIRNHTENYLIIRTSWLYGFNGPSFPRTILNIAKERPELSVVNDQHGSPTYAADLAEAVERLLPISYNGIVNVTNSGEATWYSFAREIIQQSNLKNSIIPVTTAYYPRPAPRPANSVLSNKLYQELTGHKLPQWENALQRFLSQFETS